MICAMRGWQISAMVLAVACAFLAWQLFFGHHRRPQNARRTTEHEPGERDRARDSDPAPPRTGPEVAHAISRLLPPAAPSASSGTSSAPIDDDPPPSTTQWMISFFRPHPGETMLEYRDRLLPVAKAVLQPQRDRVKRLREKFEQTANLDDAQKQALDAAVSAAGEGMKDRIMQGFMSGELDPSRMKPSGAVSFARDMLDLADGANKKFRSTLRPDQATALDADRFDVDEYLLFRTRWEDMLGVTE
jgi:hypothetical protein